MDVLKDLIRVKSAYADFLGNYIHDESKFLGDAAVAKRFVEFTRSVAHKHDYQRLISSSAMQMSHEVYRRADGRARRTPATSQVGAVVTTPLPQEWSATS